MSMYLQKYVNKNFILAFWALWIISTEIYMCRLEHHFIINFDKQSVCYQKKSDKIGVIK